MQTVLVICINPISKGGTLEQNNLALVRCSFHFLCCERRSGAFTACFSIGTRYHADAGPAPAREVAQDAAAEQASSRCSASQRTSRTKDEPPRRRSTAASYESQSLKSKCRLTLPGGFFFNSMVLASVQLLSHCRFCYSRPCVGFAGF